MTYLNDRGDKEGPLFLYQDGRSLSRASLTDWLRRILSAAGIGAATVAARNGIPDHLIQALGCWSSNAHQLYIQTPSETLARLSSQLA